MTHETQSQRESRARLSEQGAADRSALRVIDHDLAAAAAADALHHTLRSPETREDLTLFGAPEVRYVAPTGTPAGWGSGLPDPTPLPRFGSRVTRSRKGRTSFLVTGRERHSRITGDYGTDPVTRRPIIPTRTDETALIDWANRILADASDDGTLPSEYRLTERLDLQGAAAQTMSQRIGGRDYRGARSWTMVLPDDETDRSEYWCDTHDYGAEHCGCTVKIHADLGTVENGGSADGTDERLPWSPRNRIVPGNRKCPACNVAPRFHGHQYAPVTVERTSKDGTVKSVERCGHLNGRTGKPCNGTERSHGAECDGTVRTVRDGATVVECVAYDDDGSGWVGHRRVDHAPAARPTGQGTARPTTAAARRAVRAAAAAAAERRAELTGTVLPVVAAMTTGASQTIGTAIVTRIPRRWIVEASDGTTTRHATPAATVGRLAQLAP